MIIFKMPTLGRRVPGRVDYLGAIFFMAAVTPFLLALTWGNSHGWLSLRVLSTFAASLVSLGIFFAVEIGNPDALMPIGLFRNKIFAIANSGRLSGQYGLHGRDQLPAAVCRSCAASARRTAACRSCRCWAA